MRHGVIFSLEVFFNQLSIQDQFILKENNNSLSTNSNFLFVKCV